MYTILYILRVVPEESDNIVLLYYKELLSLVLVSQSVVLGLLQHFVQLTGQVSQHEADVF